jgi:hypothetical protein
MADKHILSLEVPRVANCKIFTIKDTSQYTTLLPVDCPELLITVPGFNNPAFIKTVKDFDLNLTTCTLKTQTTGCDDETLDLPDGVYVIKYSVAPNDKVYVEYNHLRVTSIMTTYYKVLCDLDVQACEPATDKKDMIDEMQYIRTLIDAAIAKVEYCTSASQGMELYNYALKRLNKILCLTSGNC